MARLSGTVSPPALARWRDVGYPPGPVIKFHYHTAGRDIDRLGVQAGDRLCHVYSDESLSELIEWGRRHGLEPEWVDRRNDLPHFDLYGARLAFCGEGVSDRELVRDLRRWRRGEAGGETSG